MSAHVILLVTMPWVRSWPAPSSAADSVSAQLPNSGSKKRPQVGLERCHDLERGGPGCTATKVRPPDGGGYNQEAR